MNQSPTVAYRPDIDGLRAFVVLAEVFYRCCLGDTACGFVDWESLVN